MKKIKYLSGTGIFLVFCLNLIVNPVRATNAEGDDGASYCYTPSRSNTPYSDLMKTIVDEPTELISYGENALQFGELWLPNHATKGSAESLPLVIFVHGGCWLNAYDIKHSQALSTGLSRAGYAVWSIEYRRTGDNGGGWPGSYNDVVQGIHFALRELSSHPSTREKIDSKHVYLIGHSAGGHLALLAATNPEIGNKLTLAIGLAAITDPETYGQGKNSCETATSKFMGGSASEAPKAYRSASLIDKEFQSKVILMTGTQDSIVSSAQAQLLDIEQMSVEGAGHFDFIDPHSWAFNALLKILGNTGRRP